VCLSSSGSLGDVGVVVLLCLRDNGGSDLCEPNRPTVCSLAAPLYNRQSAKTICRRDFDFLADFF
jgi:hypothetical protein